MLSTRDRLETIVRHHSGLPDAEILFGTTLRGDLDLDSLDLIDLALKVEGEFGVEIPDDIVDDPALSTFGGLLAHIEAKLCPDEGARRLAGMIHGNAIEFLPVPTESMSAIAALIEKAKAALNRVTGLPNGR